MKNWLNAALAFLLLMAAMFSLALGTVTVDVWVGLRDWFFHVNSSAAIVVGEIRLPRTLLSLLVGGALGLSGAALQGLLRNPLADPGLTGASQGAALGAAAVFYFGVLPAAGLFAPALAGLLGAGVAMTLMLWLAGTAQASMVLLAGLAISTISGALLATVLNFAPNPFAMQELVFWLLGSVSDRSMQHVWLLLPALLFGFVLLWRQKQFLAAISLGEEVAQSLGYRFASHSRRVVLAAAVLVGSAVSVAGAIGFVGLIVPHLLRRWVGHRPDRLLLPSAMLGAILVCVADMIVRLMPPGREIKLGVITALIGSPLFIWLIWKERKQWQA
jgi:iron complex transport system permease protein